MDDFLKRLHAHDWAAEPHSFDPPERALPALEAAWRDEPGAYELLMTALADKHTDSWFPVLLSAMPFLAEIIVRGPGVGASAAMHLLACIANTFSVDHEDETKIRDRELALIDALETLRSAAGDHRGVEPIRRRRGHLPDRRDRRALGIPALAENPGGVALRKKRVVFQGGAPWRIVSATACAGGASMRAMLARG